ncbi:MAG: hypothetical protein D5S00_06845 [Tindallia sp. MSAO_Bac2]|nr:MAG: hypothetical protein D5S00_06845 [Tindallia sp. MSAO_Bac2]
MSGVFVAGIAIINLALLYLLFFGTGKLIMGRMPKKCSFVLMGIYGTLLLLSPLVLVFGDAANYETVDMEDEYYLWAMGIEEWTLEDLLADEQLFLLDQKEIKMPEENFSETEPLIISGVDIDFKHGFSTVLEATDEVTGIEITQIMQPAAVNGIDISKHVNPWQWSMVGKELQGKAPLTEIEMYILTPVPTFYHFQREKEDNRFRGFSFISGEVVQWIRIPKEIPVEFRGIEPDRIIS